MLIEAFLRYGYVVIFAAAAVEGDATLLTATFLAHRGYFQLDAVIVVAGAATVAINQVYFWLARRHGRQRVEAMRQHRIYGRVLEWVGRYNLLLVFGSRFIYGFRIAIPAACGASGMPFLSFTICDVAGAVLWAGLVGLAGYAIGHVLEQAVDDLRAHEAWIAVALLLGVLVALSGKGRDRIGARLWSLAPSTARER